MSDPKAATPAATKTAPAPAKAAPAPAKPAPVVADSEDAVVLPKPALNTAPASAAKSATPAAGLSSVGAELHPEADVSKVDGKVTLDAGGPYVSAAPAVTPTEAVAYPSTGGLPDTGPNSKYVAGPYSGPELYNRDGQRVNGDGDLIDSYGNRLTEADVDLTINTRRAPDTNLMRQDEYLSEQTKAEMEAGKRRLDNR